MLNKELCNGCAAAADVVAVIGVRFALFFLKHLTTVNRSSRRGAHQQQACNGCDVDVTAAAVVAVVVITVRFGLFFLKHSTADHREEGVEPESWTLLLVRQSRIWFHNFNSSLISTVSR